MSLRTPDPEKDFGLRSMTIPTLSVLCEILANGYIIWFLLIDFPSRCASLAARTGGQQTCGMEIGGYVIASVSAVMILVGIYYLASWYFPHQE
jgi:hypothetical protein